MKSYDRSHSRQRSNLLRRVHNELNLGEVSILLEKTFFDLGCQLRCDGAFEFLARRFGALAKGCRARASVLRSEAGNGFNRRFRRLTDARRTHAPAPRLRIPK